MSPSIISEQGKKLGPDVLWRVCQNIRKLGISRPPSLPTRQSDGLSAQDKAVIDLSFKCRNSSGRKSLGLIWIYICRLSKTRAMVNYDILTNVSFSQHEADP